jgi:hypothetical protein
MFFRKQHGDDDRLRPRNGHTLVVLGFARISGCEDQTEVSNDDQIDHIKVIVVQLYDGPVEYRIIATVGKGESLERPELEKIRQELSKGDVDLFIGEDMGRLCRGTEAVKLFGMAVDYGTRAMSPNDGVDTIDPTWEVSAVAACHDHVAHNAHTSARIKQKKMNRFQKFGAACALPIAGYEVPEDSKTYSDWQIIHALTPLIKDGLELLKLTLNCCIVADMFNAQKMPVGKHCRRTIWDGKMVRRFFKNLILGGKVGRGFHHTVKKFKTGRRVSEINPKGPVWREYPGLAHVPLDQLMEVNALLDARNADRGRKPVNGVDVRQDVPKKRTRFLGQHGRCWYCGAHHVWGGNGMKNNLMCSRSREWRCWCSIGYSGSLAVTRVIDAITAELYKLDGFEAQFQQMVADAGGKADDTVGPRLDALRRDESALATGRSNLKKAMMAYGQNDLITEQLNELKVEDARIAKEHREIDGLLKCRELVLPKSLNELRTSLERELKALALDSYEAVPLLNKLVPEFHLYLVRLCDGRELYPRARAVLDLGVLIPDAVRIPGLPELLRRIVTIDLFEPPQRERVRADAVRLNDGKRSHAQIADLIPEKPTTTAVYRALKLQRTMLEQGLTNPFVLVEKPEDGDSLSRHKNPRYVFEPVSGYQRPPLV